MQTIDDIITTYNSLTANIDTVVNDSDRAQGGIERSIKGATVESFARSLVTIAWLELGGNMQDIRLTKGSVKVALQPSYLDKIQDDDVKKHIQNNLQNYTYSFRIDVPVYIKDELVMAIECKAYAENAMLKRILFDGSLIKRASPNTEIVLLQLESQLGGDYSDIFKEKIYGSTSTHTLMSYFDYKLHILTLLEGERKVDKPIHKKEFYKPLKQKSLENVVAFFKAHLRAYA